MATVPNWIAKAVAVGGRDSYRRAYPITAWRATATQVVVAVTMHGHSVDRRFRLDDLSEVGKHRNVALRLVAPDSDDAVAARDLEGIREADGPLGVAIESYQSFMLGHAGDRDSVEEVAAAIGRLQRAATEALASLADLL